MRAAWQQRSIARFLLVACALGGLLFGATGCAPRQSIEAVSVDASVDSYGGLDATEERTLVLPQGGAVEWAFTFRVGAVFDVLSVSGTDGDYVLADDPSAEEPGTYAVTGDDDQMQIVAFTEPSDSPQTLTLHYAVQGVGQRWNDTSEFSWRFVRDAEKLPIESVSIHVALPGEVSDADVRAWANGPLYSTTAVNEDSSIDVTARELPRKTGIEVRSLFPVDALPERMVSPWKREADVLEYENDIALQVSMGRFLDRGRLALGWLIGLLVPVLGLGYTLAYRWNHRAEFRPPFSGEHYREAPAEIMPAMAASLLGGEVSAEGALAATIADLIDRGALSLSCRGQEIAACRLSRLPSGASPMTRSEQYLVAALFDDVAGADSFTLAELGQRLSADDGAAAWARVAAEFRERVGYELVMRRYLEHRVTTAGTTFMVLAGVLLGAGLIARSMTESLVPVAVALVVSPIVAVLARKMRFVTQQAEDLAGKYRGVRSYLRDLPSLEEALPASVDQWRELLPLAVLFGMAESVVGTVESRLPEVADAIEPERWRWAEALAKLSAPAS